MKAKLQDFDDDWHFVGGKVSAARQIGNAVPPRLAQAVGMSLYSAIKGVKWNWEAALWPEVAGRTPMPAPPLQMPEADYVPASSAIVKSGLTSEI